MVFYIVYALVSIILILHVTGWLKDKSMEGVIFLAPVAIFAIIIVDYLNII